MTAHAKLRAVSGDPAALKVFIKEEQAKRDATAVKTWEKYALFRADGYNYYTHIINPDGLRYRHETTVNGPHRFVGPPDNTFIDSVNAAAARLGIADRLEGKHFKVAEKIQEAIRRGHRTWIYCPATDGWPSGYVTVDASALPAPSQPAKRLPANDFGTAANSGRAMASVVGATGQGG